MQDLPHHYKVEASAGPDGDAALSCDGLETMPSASPAEFGGPGNRWSPETLLTASVAGCFILSFRAIARASKFSWTSLQCEVEGTLEQVERTMKFTRFAVRATLQVPQDADEKRAHLLLDKAEKTCLVTNSLSSETQLHAEVRKAP